METKNIKFRGKGIDDRKWHYGFLFDDAMGNMFITHYKNDRNGNIIDVQEQVDEDSIGQHIFIKDKNWNEIYEGDILTWKWNKMEREFLIIEDIFTVWREMLNKENWELPSICEVIGNIYDNTDLIKKIKAGEKNIFTI